MLSFVDVQHTNMFWPQWKPGLHKIEQKILMPELVRLTHYTTVLAAVPTHSAWPF